MSNILIALIPMLVLLADEQPLVRRVGSEVLARGSLIADGTSVRGEMVLSGTRVKGSMTWSRDGVVSAYDRQVRTIDGDHLISRVQILEVESGYSFRESGPLGSRTLILKVAPISVVVDGEWPEALISVMMNQNLKFVRALEVSTRKVDLVEIMKRAGGARYLDLESGGVTVEIDKSGRFKRCVVPGTPRLEILPAGADARPTEAAVPAGVVESAFTLKSGEADLRGLYSRPQTRAGPAPGVVLLPDAGERNRDGDGEGSGSGLLRYLAHELAKAGYATVRWDKRGSYESTGPDLGLAGLTRDAQAAAVWLSTQKEVSKSQLALCGHGEGGLVATEAARGRPDLVRSVVTLGAPARSLLFTLQSRLRDRLRAEGLGLEEVEARVAALRKDLEALRDLSPEKAAGSDQRLLHDLLQISPADSYQKLESSVLILYGQDDHLVPHGHRALLRSTLSLISGFEFSFRNLRSCDHEFLQTSGRGAGALRPSATDVARPRSPALILFIKNHFEKLLAPERRKG